MDAFQLEEMETPEPGAFEVTVRVMAAGVNFNNVWAALGKPIWRRRGSRGPRGPSWSAACARRTRTGRTRASTGCWPASACSTTAPSSPWLTLDHHLQVLRGLWEHDPFDRFATITTPVLLLPADDGDASATAEKEAAVARALSTLPAGRVHWFRPADHDVHAQHPAEVAAVLHDAVVGPRVGRDASPADDHGLRRDRADDDQGAPGGVRPPRARPSRARCSSTRRTASRPTPTSSRTGRWSTSASPSAARVEVAQLRRTRHRRHRRRRAGARADPRRRLVVHGSWQPVVRAPPVGGDAGARRAGRPPAARRSRRGAGVLERGRADAWASPPCPVYEIYKVGADPLWLDGLDLLTRARAAGRRHPPLRQHGGRQPRHPLLLPRSTAGWSSSSGSCPTARSCSASTSTPA